MPFIRPPKPKRSTRKPPRKAKDKGASPWSVSPEWEAEGELPNLRDKDSFPLPWGGQIEHTLSRPIDPLDCTAWPSSPYCDISSTFDFSSFAGIDIDVSANPCGGVVRVQPRVFWLNLAPQTIVYRRDDPECQPEVPAPLPTTGSLPYGFRAYKFGHWGCMYRIRINTTVENKDNLPWVYKNDDWNTDFWGPLEGFGTYIQAYNTPSGIMHHQIFQVFAHGHAAFYPFGYGDPNWPGINPSWTPVNVWRRAVQSQVYAPEEIQYQIISLEEIKDGPMAWTPGLDPWLPAKIQFNRENCGKWKQLPPPPLPELDDPMCDCKSMQADLKAIKKILGADKGGWKVPAKLTGLSTEMVEFNNYAELFLWTIKSFSETLGDTEIKIKLKDADLTQDGDQSQELSYANLGEAVADILGLLLDNKGLSGAIYKASAHGLAQSAVATIAASKTLKIVEDIADFLDYKVEEEEEDIELFLNPTKEDPSEYLDKSTQKFTYPKYKGKNSLSTHLHDLLFAAALIRAQYWHRVDDEGFARFEAAVEEGQSDLDTYLEKVEQGFPAEPGTVDTSRPYGRPYDERPRIKKISQPKNDGSNT